MGASLNSVLMPFPLSPPELLMPPLTAGVKVSPSQCSWSLWQPRLTAIGFNRRDGRPWVG